MKNVRLTPRMKRAVELVARDEKSDEKIAEEIGVSKVSLTKWKRRLDFQVAVKRAVDAQTEAIRAEGIANKQNRVDALNDRWLRSKRVIAERAADPTMADVPGGQSGLMVKNWKQVGVGRDAQFVAEYSVDTALMAEMRATEKAAALELNQLAENGKGEFGSGANHLTVEIVHVESPPARIAIASSWTVEGEAREVPL